MISSFRLPGWLVVLLRIVIAAIFIYAGATKVIAPLRFTSDIDNFHILPWPAPALLAFYLPWLEIICGMTLLFARFDRGALLILLPLTLVFVAALTSAQIRGLDISCGCFGHGTRDLSFASHIALNLGILAALILFLRRSNTKVQA
jgi:uncharacterized membrane protein YphA (DoxX/SURF4 family)